MSVKGSIEKRFIGVDLHTNRFNICETTQYSTEKVHRQFAINERDIQKFIELVDKNTYVMLESCANSFKFYERISPHVAEVIIADPRKLKIISHTNKKTDKVDAQKISSILKMQIMTGERLINEVYVPNEDIQTLRSLFTTYNQFKKHISCVKNYIHSLLKKNLIVLPDGILSKTMIARINKLDLPDQLRFQIDILIEELINLENKKDRVETQIKLMGTGFYKEIELLTSIKGISVLSALAIIADIAQINRFPNAKHLCSYLRSAPSVESSNAITKVKSTNKFSRKLSMTFLTQSVAHFKNTNPSLKSWYEFKTKTVKKGKIRMATCRRLIVQIYHMLKNNEFHYYRDIDNHNKKLNQYNRFLEKNQMKVLKTA